VLLLTVVAAAVLTDRAYDARPGTGAVASRSWLVAAVLVAGALLSGGVPRAAARAGRHPLVRPVLTGVLLFVTFVVAGWFVRLLPFADHAVADLLRRADRDGAFAVALAAAGAAVAEEVFYRGALFERVRAPVITTTLAHVVTTLPAGNVALTAAAAILGVVLGASRRASGGWWAPAVTHVTWSLLVIAWLPR
jgi:membrane protease YdiL (CAAX protease family)